MVGRANPPSAKRPEEASQRSDFFPMEEKLGDLDGRECDMQSLSRMDISVRSTNLSNLTYS